MHKLLYFPHFYNIFEIQMGVLIKEKNAENPKKIKTIEYSG